ncbi:MAG: restriction endonuclease [bacterium]|nr:restriction endonuclease [bacterium]
MNDKPKIYLTRAGRNGEDEERALENDLAIIGFREVPSLAVAKDYEGVHGIVSEAFPEAKPRAVGNLAGQLWAFALAIGEGDLVVLPRKLTSQIAIGRVTGPYDYREVEGALRHTRPVEWIQTDIPRTVFGQDLLYSFGAYMTVCNISRNDAELRVAAVAEGKADPGVSAVVDASAARSVDVDEQLEALPDLSQLAHDQIVAYIQARFSGHGLADLVNAVLRAEGWVTKLSPPGPDGGVDILAGRGSLGLDEPRLCVQVKSQNSPADVTVYRTLQGSMQTFNAEQGLLVCWGGFNKSVLTEARTRHFSVRLWDSSDLVEGVYRTYERLPEEIRAELPLKREWMLVVEQAEP